MIVDLLETAGYRVLDKVIERHGRARHVVEQRFQRGMEQRQPMLHAGITGAGADRLVQRIGRGDGAEHLDVARAEQALGVRPERQFRGRDQNQLIDGLGRALRLRIEGADLFNGVAEEVEPQRLRAAGRIEIEDAAAHGIFAVFHDRAGPPETGLFQPLDQLVHIDVLAGRQGFQRFANELARRHPLQGGIDRRDDDGRLAPPWRSRERPARTAALRRSRHRARRGRRARNPRRG